MKSFFKKLAFVMALAMVVSLAAPAAKTVAFAAEKLGVVAQDDTTWTALETDELAVGEVKDYKFSGAPKNWKDYKWVWKSSNEEVATVNAITGEVTAVADGVVTITVSDADAQYVGTIEITVGKGNVEDNSYVYKQVSHKVATFTFNHDVDFKASDVILTKVFEGGYEVNWPIETFKCEGNVVTIAPYVAFSDGDKYIIKIGAEDEGTPFTTKLGAVDYIDISYKSLDKDGKAYAKLDEDDEDIEVVLSVKLYSNGVDVSEAPGYSMDNVEFKLEEESDYFDLDENIIIFEKPGVVALVTATYTYEVDGEDVTKSDTAPVIAEPAPRYTIVSVDKWTVAQRGNADVKIDWTGSLLHSIPAFDENNYSIVVLMTDSYGNKIVYPNEFKDNSKYGDKTILALSDITDASSDDFIAAAEDFEINFTSTNTGKIFVGTENGDITTLGISKAPILVSLYDENNDGDTVLVKNLFAADLEVTAERHADDVKATVLFDKLLVDVNEVVDAKYETGKVKFVVKDQYEVPVAGVKVKVTESNDNIKVIETSTVTNADGEATVEFDGDDFIYYSNSKKKNVAVDSVKFTAQVIDTNVKTTFTVKTETPEVKNGALVVEDYEVVANNVDQKIAKKADGTVKTTDITLFQTSNHMHVGTETTTKLVTKGSSFLKDGEGAFSIKSSEAKLNDMFIVVYGPNGKALEQTATSTALGIYEKTPGEYSVCVATASGSAMTYLATGTYTVEAYQVTKLYEGDKAAKLDKFVTTFTVSNSTDKVSLKKQDKIDLSDTAHDLTDVIFDAFTFKLGSGELNEDKAIITNVEYKYNAASDYVFIYNVTFDVPLNNGSDDVYYTSGKVTVNKSVKVNENFNDTWK